MKKKNNITKYSIYALVTAILVYGIGIATFGDIGDQRFSFSDGEDFKKGLFATNPVNKISSSWIQWELTYSDGTSEVGRTGKTTDSFAPFTLVKSIDDQRIINEAEFIVYSDFSNIGNQLCIDTPRMTIKQTVLVNGQPTNVLKQLIQYNEMDSRNILKGTGVKITPSFFESQVLTGYGPLDSGDEIAFILDANGRFEISEVNPSTGNCLSTAVAEGFIEGLHSEFNLVYGDPLDILLGTFPFEQTEITDQQTTVDVCQNGNCQTIVIEESPDTQQGIADTEITVTETPTETVITTATTSTVYDPVCASDGKTYSNQDVADSFGANVLYTGICIEEQITDIINPTPIAENPTGIDGVVGVCDPLIADCSEGSVDIANYVRQVQEDQFKFTGFEFIMLSIIGIIIVVIILSRLVNTKR